MHPFACLFTVISSSYKHPKIKIEAEIALEKETSIIPNWDPPPPSNNGE